MDVGAAEAKFGEHSWTLARDALTTLEMGYKAPAELHAARTPLGDGSVDGTVDATYREGLPPRLSEWFGSRAMDGKQENGSRVSDILMPAVDADGSLFEYDGVAYHASGAPATMSMPFAPLLSVSEDWAVVDATSAMAFPTSEGPTVTVDRLQARAAHGPLQ